MSELKQFKLPDVGEGLTEADIVKWHVQPGDKVTINQIIVEIETAKAVVELPSPYEGVVADLLVPEGTTADVGTPIISVQVGAASATRMIRAAHPVGDGTPADGDARPPTRRGPAQRPADRHCQSASRRRLPKARSSRASTAARRPRRSARPSWSATASSSARPPAGPGSPPPPARRLAARSRAPAGLRPPRPATAASGTARPRPPHPPPAPRSAGRTVADARPAPVRRAARRTAAGRRPGQAAGPQAGQGTRRGPRPG